MASTRNLLPHAAFERLAKAFAQQVGSSAERQQDHFWAASRGCQADLSIFTDLGSTNSKANQFFLQLLQVFLSTCNEDEFANFACVLRPVPHLQHLGVPTQIAAASLPRTPNRSHKFPPHIFTSSLKKHTLEKGCPVTGTWRNRIGDTVIPCKRHATPGGHNVCAQGHYPEPASCGRKLSMECVRHAAGWVLMQRVGSLRLAQSPLHWAPAMLVMLWSADAKDLKRTPFLRTTHIGMIPPASRRIFGKSDEGVCGLHKASNRVTLLAALWGSSLNQCPFLTWPACKPRQPAPPLPLLLNLEEAPLAGSPGTAPSPPPSLPP